MRNLMALHEIISLLKINKSYPIQIYFILLIIVINRNTKIVLTVLVIGFLIAVPKVNNQNSASVF